MKDDRRHNTKLQNQNA